MSIEYNGFTINNPSSIALMMLQFPEYPLQKGYRKNSAGNVVECDVWKRTGLYSFYQAGNEYNPNSVHLYGSQDIGKIYSDAMIGFYFYAKSASVSSTGINTNNLKDVAIRGVLCKKTNYNVTGSYGIKSYIQRNQNRDSGEWFDYSTSTGSLVKNSGFSGNITLGSLNLPIKDSDTNFTNIFQDLYYKDYNDYIELRNAINTFATHATNGNLNDWYIFFPCTPARSTTSVDAHKYLADYKDSDIVSIAIPSYTLNHGVEAGIAISTGNTENADNIKELEIETGDALRTLSTAWKFNLVGDFEPRITITWDSYAIQSAIAKYGKELEDLIKVHITRYQASPQGEPFEFVFNWNVPNVTLTWEQAGGTATNDIRFDVYVEYEGVRNSSEMYAVIPNTIPVTDVAERGADGSTVEITYSEDEDTYEEYKGQESTITGSETSLGDTYTSALTTTYVVTETELNNLASFIWNNDAFKDNIKEINNSPIENIVSVKIVPTNVPSGTAQSIVLGNVNTGVGSHKTNNSVIVNIGSIQIPSYYNSFLDYHPYTSVGIFLPFIGFKELEVIKIEGKTINVKYIFDLITGMVEACIFADNLYIASYHGVGCIDIPVTASNNAQNQNSFISSIADGFKGAVAGTIATGSPVAGIAVGFGSALISATKDYALAPLHYTTEGSYSPSCAWSETRNCYLIVDRPVAQYPSSYGHDFGYPCKLTRTLSSLNGFTMVGFDLDLSGVSCLEEEKEMLKTILTTGVYL